ncbi:tetratricopeptide repeat protein [Azoarcus sp. TTM-91]|uniref:tetratricopeptide repeat protein n=1 Tax=Azoarcus sp. TTM-91 TaxID=2691581 RepID=UPI00145CB262|nr:tetratricopeptide repeat protein [Azoarcus sp. TTM-91]
MTSVQSLYEEALGAQLAGKNDEAIQAYQALLAEAPAHAEGNHNLGLLEFSRGNVDQALERLMNAIEARPAESQFWHSLLEVLLAAGAAGHAVQMLEQAAGSGIGEDELQKMRERIAAATAPVVVEAPVAGPVKLAADEQEKELLAAVAQIIRRSRAQMASGKRALVKGRVVDSKTFDRLVELFNQGELQELERRALQLTKSHPLHPAGWHFLGTARFRLGERMAALKALIKANEAFPADAQMLDHLAAAMSSFNYLAEAEELFKLSLEIRPEKVDTLVRYINMEVNRRSFEQAEILARRAVALAPDYALACQAMALVLLSTRRGEEAIPYLERAIKADPKFGGAYQDLGYAYFNQGRLADAIQTSQLAVDNNPDHPPSYSNLLFFLTHDYRLSPEAVLDKHLEFGRRFETQLLGTHRPHDNQPEPERRIRLGFVSADLYNHAVATFFEPVLARLDKTQFELFAFHNTVKFDEVSERLKQNFNYWVSVAHVSDKDLAEIIRACRIDILVDLSGHTAGNRLLTFARKPAPVQITAVGYADTTGLKSMDYFLTDRYIAPPGQLDGLFSEKLLRADSATSFTFADDAPPVAELPALRNGYLTFGSFNRPGKITAPTLDLWAGLLNRIPAARMLIGSVDSNTIQKQLESEFEARGVAPSRLRFMGRAKMRRYLAAHADIDVLLDTVPYNAGTTALHSVWMGVPILTLQGRRLVSNLGASVMSKIELPEFIGVDEDDFIAKGVALAQRPECLAEIRLGLRQRLVATQLFTPECAARSWERAFREVWRSWCSEQQGSGPAA